MNKHQSPRRVDKLYETDEQFHEALETLNGITSEYRAFRVTRANQDHTDLFGVAILAGDFYYRREYGYAWGADVKLARISMERICFAIVAGNEFLQTIATSINQGRKQALAGAIALLDQKAYLSRG